MKKDAASSFVPKYRIKRRFLGCELQEQKWDAGNRMHWVPLNAEGKPHDNGWFTTGIVRPGPVLDHHEAVQLFERLSAKRGGKLIFADAWVGMVLLAAGCVLFLWVWLMTAS